MSHSPSLFTVIYSFHIHSGKESEFIKAWTTLTELIYQYEGSYGSRLHKVNDHLFIGYAQWPSKEHWKNSGSSLPIEANVFRGQMRECCIAINTAYEMSVVSDLLRTKLYSN